MTTKHETPILTSILNSFGIATIVFAFFYGAFVSFGDSPRGGIFVIVGGLFAGLIYIGLAQAVDFLARTAFSTDRVCTILESSITERLRAIESGCFASPVTTRLSGSNIRYFYSTNEEQQGPVEAGDLRMMRKDGLVTEDTPVLREGESKWRRFRDYLTLNR